MKERPGHPHTPLTPKQVAERTGFSLSTIYKYCRVDANPQIAHTVGPDGRIRITPEAVDEWLAAFKHRKKRNKKNE